MKNGNFEMDDEEYMEALDLRDEYRYAYKLNHNNPWWNELEEYQMPYTGFVLTTEEKELQFVLENSYHDYNNH